MTMMFEVEDLAVASPATVSRCGMVYMEPESLGYQPLIDSWVDKLPQTLVEKSKTFKILIKKLFDDYIGPCLTFIRKNAKEVVTSTNNNLAQSLMRILDCYLAAYTDSEVKKITADEIEQLQ
jgi:dynein heavy chain